MHNNSFLNRNLDACFYKLEQLSSKIADSITVGDFGEVTKLDLARKDILSKISKDTDNFNKREKTRLKLVWINNCKLINEAENSMLKRQESFNKLRKTLKAYSKND